MTLSSQKARFSWLLTHEMNIPQNVITYDACWLGADRLADKQQLRQLIMQDLESSGMTIPNLQQHTLIVDCRGEGHCDSLLRPLIDLMRDVPVADLVVLYNSVIDVGTLPYTATTFPTWILPPRDWISRYGWPDPMPKVNRKFICLMRRPSPSRARLARRLMDADLDVLMSFGVGAVWPDCLTDWKPYFPESVTLPIAIDSTTMYSSIDFHPEMFMPCAVNIIAESSSQDHDNSWYSIFITEKTGKCFYQRQIPLWWAVPGVVKAVRDLGFDVFDDVIDHSYDAEIDSERRLDSLMHQIQILDRMDLSELRQRLWSRLERNFGRLVKIHSEPGPTWEQILASAKNRSTTVDHDLNIL